MEQGGLAHHHGDTSSFCLQMLTFVDSSESIETSPKENKESKCKNQLKIFFLTSHSFKETPEISVDTAEDHHSDS